MINAVFRRLRDDKTVKPDAIRMSQITDLVPIETAATAQSVQLPCSTILRREVFSKNTETGLCVRKAVSWKTNKDEVDPLYPSYVVFFTDFTPGREHPLKTDIRTASSLDKINALTETWIAQKITRGWRHYGAIGTEMEIQPPSLPASCTAGQEFQLNLEMSFSRTPSVNFQVAVRRIKAMTQAGNITIENDPKDRPLHYTITFGQHKLVENIRRIENLYRLISRWKGAEFLVNGDPLGYHDFQDVINAINDIAACWRYQKRYDNICRSSFTLGCKRLQFKPSAGFPGIARDEPAWYAVGEFDGQHVALNKDALLVQLSTPKNERLSLCPLFKRELALVRIKGLPDKLTPVAEGNRWAMGYNIHNQKPVWVFPKNIRQLPFGVTLELDTNPVPDKNRVVSFGIISPLVLPPFSRNIPPTRYADICGQDKAVEAVRDYVELPLKHAELFQRMGVKPGRGILLHGPPGNGKTLLARAVAGESGAHIETIAGPEVLSKWVGESERMLREIFQRAAQFAPSVIIMDEVDTIAGSRDSSEFNHLREIVSQLLVLMDGLTDRGRILIIATTNCLNSIDPAILRPGRIDRKVFIGPPNKNGRIALLTKLLSRMPTADDVQPESLADLTHGFSGAEIEHITNEAGLLTIKESLAQKTSADSARVAASHFFQAINTVKKIYPQ